MTNPRKRRRTDSTVIMTQREGRPERSISATQILSAAEARAAGRKPKRVGDSSVILRDGDRSLRMGLGVAVKFALAVSATMVVFMGLFGAVIYNNVNGSLNDEIDAAGIQAARCLAIPDFATWNIFHRAYRSTKYGGFEEEISRGEKKIREGDLTAAQLDLAERTKSFNKTRLERLLTKDGRILDAVISNPDRTKIIRLASGGKQLEFAGRSRPDKGGVRIETGTYTLPGGKTLSARSYVAPIVNGRGEVTGQATVVLSEEAIQKKLAAVRAQILVLAVVFILLGVGVAFLMGKQITAPITELTRDVEIIAKGKLDHHPRARTKDEIGVLAQTVERMAKSLSAAQDAEVGHAKQKHQLSVALEIQSNLFPEKLPEAEGYEVEAYYQPGPEVGGDYYDVITLPDGRLLLMVASASGKGIPAAMLTTMARSFTTAVAERAETVAELFKSVNRLLSPDLRRGMYVTSAACVLDPATGKLVVVNAGHNPLILYRAEKKSVEPVHSDGIALGFDKGPVFDRSLKEVEIQLEKSDRIVLCAPGLFGIKNHDGRELGEENFYRLVAREAAKDSTAFVKLVANTLEKFAEDGYLETDITYVTLRRMV